MADPSLAQLAALFGSNSTSGSDLDIFANDIAGSDYYGMAAAPVLGAKFDTRTWSPGQTAAVTAGQAFLGSLLQNYGKYQQAQQMKAVASVIPELYTNPGAVPVPEGVDEAAFARLEGSIAKQKILQDIKSQQDIKNQERLAEIAGITAEKTAEGKIRGENKGYGTTGGANPDNPIEKKATELKTDFNKLPEVINYKYATRLSDQLVRTLRNPSAVSDQALAKMLVQIVEPGTSANQGETDGLAKSTSIPTAWKGDIAKAMSGKSKFLDPTIRQGMLDLMASGFEAHGRVYGEAYSQYADEAKRFNIDMDRISSLGAPSSFQDLSKSIVTPGNGGSGVNNNKQATLDALALKYPPTIEGRAQFKAAAEKILAGG